MSEFVYGLNQRTGPRPIIRKIGAIAPDGMEQTPVIFKGAAYSVESAFANEYCPVQHLHVRNIETGELSPPFGANYYFASAFVEGDTLYAFATSQRDDRPMTMYQSEDSASWHDPRGGHTVRMFYHDGPNKLGRARYHPLSRQAALEYIGMQRSRRLCYGD
jgi:hypothetical protein